MAKLFNYDNLEQIKLPNPMSIDKSIIRTSILPSLLNIYEYNKARKVEDVLIYEISKTYSKDYIEDTKIAMLLKGTYLTNNWQHNCVKIDFYLVKGIVENILNYLGLKNRYTFIQTEISSLHPGISAKIILDKEEIGIIGRIHPSINKDEIYLAELSLNKLIKTIKPIKYIPSSRYPEIKKDVSFIIDKSTTCKELIDTIKKSGGRLLSDVSVFDVYTGSNIKDNELSIAFSLTFKDELRTLTDEEVMNIFNNIIKDVTTKHHAVLRDN